MFAYMLLFRFKDNIALYAAVPLTLITLGMASMNLVAGAQNFQVFVDTAALDRQYTLRVTSNDCHPKLGDTINPKTHDYPPQTATKPKNGLNVLLASDVVCGDRCLLECRVYV